MVQLVPLPYLEGDLLNKDSDRLHDFSVTIPSRDKDVYINTFFPCATTLGILCH